MEGITRFRMRAPAPSLSFFLVDGSTWSLLEQSPEAFSVVVFYRGLHCPLCRAYLAEFDQKLDEFEAAGAKVVAVSADDATRAMQAKTEWQLGRLPIGYGLSTDAAREWGLFISRSIRDGEPAEFFEPGLFLVKPDGTLFYGAITSAPWGRPPVDHVLFGIKMAIQRGTPARGEA